MNRICPQPVRARTEANFEAGSRLPGARTEPAPEQIRQLVPLRTSRPSDVAELLREAELPDRAADPDLRFAIRKFLAPGWELQDRITVIGDDAADEPLG